MPRRRGRLVRTDAELVAFVRRFWETGRPAAAVCHGPQLLIEADVVRGASLRISTRSVALEAKLG